MLRSALALLAISLLVVPAASAEPEHAAHDCVRGRELWFQAADGTRLVGHRFGRGDRAILLGHQSGSSLCEWLPYARELARKGWFVFAYDYRGHGFSAHAANPRYATRLGLDVVAAVKAVRRLGKKKVVLVGASMGGIASLAGAPSIRPPVDGVVSVSAPAEYIGMNAARAVRTLRAPVLYVASTDDDGGRFAVDARRMYRATASRDKRIRIFDSYLHGTALVEGTPAVKRLVEAFAARVAR